ncbi:MAG TPA: hypothetical protein VGN14_01440, partial [Candidatus Elarobacter sp.]
VVSIAIFDLWSNGQYPVIAALGCVLVALLLTLVTLVQRLGGRIGLALRLRSARDEGPSTSSG